jgi:hypothetical protein
VRVLIFFVVVGGCNVQIRIICTIRERGHEFRGIGGTNFKDVLRVFLLQQGRTDQTIQQVVDMFSKVLFF